MDVVDAARSAGEPSARQYEDISDAEDTVSSLHNAVGRAQALLDIVIQSSASLHASPGLSDCGSPPGVIVADTLSFNAKIGLVDF